jgi:RNA polymerase primary sigma factor
MPSKAKVTPQKEPVPAKEGPETPPDSPLLDLLDAAVKKLIRTAKKRGYVTHDEINSVLPSEEVNSEQIEDVLAMFSEMGVNVVETEDASEDGEEQREEPEEETESEGGELIEVQQKVPAKSEAKEPTERTDDPVRMYLREWVRWSSSRARARSRSPSAPGPHRRPRGCGAFRPCRDRDSKKSGSNEYVRNTATE